MSVINVRKKELNKNGYNDFEHWNGISDAYAMACI